MGEMIKAYKGFDKNLKCRDFQYEIGKVATNFKGNKRTILRRV